MAKEVERLATNLPPPAVAQEIYIAKLWQAKQEDDKGGGIFRILFEEEIEEFQLESKRDTTPR